MKKLIIFSLFSVLSAMSAFAQIAQEPVQTPCGVVTPFIPFPCIKAKSPTPTAPPVAEPVIPAAPVTSALLCSTARSFNVSNNSNYIVPFHVDVTNAPAVAPYPYPSSPFIQGPAYAVNFQCTIDYLTLTNYILPYVKTYSAYPAWWAANQAAYLQKAANYSGDAFEYNGTIYSPAK